MARDCDLAVGASKIMTVIASCIHSMASTGGSELNAVRTVEQLALRHHRVIVLTFDKNQEGMYKRYLRAGAEVAAFPVGSLVSAKALLQVIRMASLMKTRGVEIVITHDVYSNFLMILAARYAGIPSIASKRYTAYTYPQHRITDRIGFRLATRILANSASVAESIRLEPEIVRRKVRVVPNFIDDAVFLYGARRDEWVKRFGLRSTDTIYGIIAQLRAEKNHILLLDTFCVLAGEIENVHLLIVGDGPERESIQAHIQKLGLNRRVTLAGHVPAAWQVFAAIDVALLPSSHEGFPNSLIEAMAMGVPVIASDVGGIADAVSDSTTGLLVHPGDFGALLQAMRRLAGEPHRRHTLGVNAQAFVRERFSVAAVTPKLERLIEETMGAGI